MYPHAFAFYDNNFGFVNFRYTSKKTSAGTTMVYAIVLEWPKTSTLSLGAPKVGTGTSVSLVGSGGADLTFKARPGGGIDITMPSVNFSDLPCKWAWVLQMAGLE